MTIRDVLLEAAEAVIASQAESIDPQGQRDALHRLHEAAAAVRDDGISRDKTADGIALYDAITIQPAYNVDHKLLGMIYVIDELNAGVIVFGLKAVNDVGAAHVAPLVELAKQEMREKANTIVKPGDEGWMQPDLHARRN